MKRAIVRELVVTSGVLAFSLLVLLVLIPTQIEQDASYDMASLSPAFFPELATFLIMGLSLLLLGSHLRRAAGGQLPIEEDAEPLSREEEFNVLKAIGVALAYFFALDYVGFLLTNTLAVGVLIRMQGRMPIWKLIGISVGTTVCVYLFFYYVMRVHFPMGQLFR